MSFAKGREAQARKKVKSNRPNNLVPKATGASAKDYKRPVRDQAHMARIAALGCLVCGHPSHAHHCDVVVAKGMGPKVSDYMTAPLCPTHHLDDKHDCAHGFGGERAFWARHWIDIAAWLIRTLTEWYPPGTNPGAAAAIAAITNHRKIQ